MKAPHCTGEAKPPKMSAECEAECNAKVSAKLKCVPARVAVTIDGAKNMAAAGKLRAALGSGQVAWAVTAISPPGGVWVNALSSRLRNTCPTR